ncbi:MAG: type 4a pilus biogenesis protein PilO [Actinomycetota bacterium]
MNRRLILIAAALSVAVIGLWWVFLFSPAGDDLAAAEDRRDGAETQLVTLREQRDRLSLLVEQRPFFQSELESLRAAVPEDDDLAGIILSIDEAAKASGVTFESFSASESGTPDGFGLSPVLLQASGDGGYFQVLDFINRLNRIHRIVVIESLSLTSAASAEDLGPPRLTWTMGMTTFVTPSAVPVDPAAGDPAAVDTAATPTDAPADGGETDSGGVE